MYGKWYFQAKISHVKNFLFSKIPFVLNSLLIIYKKFYLQNFFIFQKWFNKFTAESGKTFCHKKSFFETRPVLNNTVTIKRQHSNCKETAQFYMRIQYWMNNKSRQKQMCIRQVCQYEYCSTTSAANKNGKKKNIFVNCFKQFRSKLFFANRKFQFRHLKHVPLLFTRVFNLAGYKRVDLKNLTMKTKNRCKEYINREGKNQKPVDVMLQLKNI